MNQEITISKDIIKFFFDNASYYQKDNIAFKCFETIEENMIVSDDKRIYYRELLKNLDILPDGDKKNAIHEVLRNWQERKTVLFKYELKEFNELDLCSISNDKIYFDPYKSEKEYKIEFEKNPSIECHNKNTFIHPKIYHRFKKVPSEFRFENGVRYNLCHILGPFFRNSKEIVVTDPYLPNEKAIYNFTKIVKVFPNNSNIVIRTYKEKDYTQNNEKKSHLYKNYKRVIDNLIKEGYNIIENDLNHSKHIDRYICTESFEISLPGGFDFLDEKGYVKLESKSEVKKITITFK